MNLDALSKQQHITCMQAKSNAPNGKSNCKSPGPGDNSWRTPCDPYAGVAIKHAVTILGNGGPCGVQLNDYRSDVFTRPGARVNVPIVSTRPGQPFCPLFRTRFGDFGANY